MMNIITGMILKPQLKAENFFKKENGQVNIIAIVILIGIAIMLALIFKDRISTLIGSLFDTIDTNAQSAVSN